MIPSPFPPAKPSATMLYCAGCTPYAITFNSYCKPLFIKIARQYATEFPTMITRWRSAFETPGLPFFYVELCTEYGAEEPKENDFWMAQRAALR